MARRVNTKFVVVLGGMLVLGSGGVMAFYARTYLHNHDPKFWQAQGDEALAKHDLKGAIFYYGQAANASSRSHQPGTEKLYDKLGDMSMQLSGQTKDPIESGKYYGSAQSAWLRALTENASYVPAREKLIEEQYKIATFELRTESWKALEETASKLTVQDKHYGKAFTYLAAARVALLQSASAIAISTEQLRGVEGDILRAKKEDPTNAEAWVLEANLRQMQAGRLSGVDAKEGEKLLAGAIVDLKGFLEKHPNDADASMALASLYWGIKDRDSAVKVLESAVAAHPTHVRAASMLATCYGELRLVDKAEGTLKGLVAVASSDPDAYMAEAKFYQATQHPAEAIAAFGKVMEHEQAGGGITSNLNIRREVESLYNISWLYMDIVEAKTRSRQTDASKAALAQAEVYVGKLRAAPSLKQSQDLLEGRLQLLKGNTRDAITSLTRADSVFGKGSATSPQWFQAKAVLSQAYELNTNWGLALRYLDEILAQFPQNPAVMLQKARVLNRVARWKEALELVQPFGNPAAEAKVPLELQQAAWAVEADAFRGLQMNKQYEEMMHKIGGDRSILAMASERIRGNDLAGALEEVNSLLKTSPNNEGALVLGVVVNLRLDDKEAAKALLARALPLYPKNTQLQVIQSLLSKNGGDTKEMQLEALEAITDPFTRHMAKAQYYAQLHDRDKQIAEIAAGQKAYEDANGSQSGEVTSDLSDQIFMLNLGAAEDARNAGLAAQARADHAKDGDKKSAALKEKAEADKAYKKYWDQAELLAQRAERLNLDGVEGKLYRGRLDFSRGGDSRHAGMLTLQQAAAERPNSSVIRTVLGQAYYMSRSESASNAEKALAELREAIQQKPDNIPALKMAIDLLMTKGTQQSLNEATLDMKQALAFAPRDVQLQRVRDQLGDPAEAILQREEIRKEHPDDLENIRSLAILHVRQGEPLKGVELLKIIEAKYPDDLMLADTIAHLLHEGHKDNDALTIYEHFIGSDNADIRFRALLMLGDMYRAMNRPEQALATYRGAVEKQDGTDEAQRRMADLYFDLDDMKSAEAEYRKIYDAEGTGKKDVRVLRRLVESMLRQDKFAAADMEINALLKEQPEDPDGWILRGFGLLRQHKTAEAIACFDRVSKANPDNLDALHYRAYAEFLSQGDLNLAIKDLLTIRERDPNRVNSRILLAKTYKLVNRFAESADEYEEVIKLQPDVPGYRIEYAEFLLAVADVSEKLSPDNREDFAASVRVVKPVERLERLLDDSSGRFPDQPIWLVLEGNLLTLKGRSAEGLQKYQEAFAKSNGNPQMASTYLGALLRAGDYEKVIGVVNELLPRAPKYGDYLLKRGAAYGKTGRSTEAMADFAEAMKLSGADLNLYLSVVRAAESAVPTATLTGYLDGRLKADAGDSGARIALADIYLTKNQGAEAAKMVAPLLGDASQPYHALVLRMAGMGRYQAKDLQGAYEAYMALLKITPNDLEVMNNLAYLLAEDMKRPKEGLVYAERAASILRSGKVDMAFVNNGNVYDTLGWVKYLTGDVAGALTELKRAQQIEPTPIVYFHLAKALMASDKEGSRKAVAEGIRLATQTKDPVLAQLQSLRKEVGVE